jgi:twinkle protein
MGRHVPCSEGGVEGACASSDAGWIDEDGSFTCFSCRRKRSAREMAGVEGAGEPKAPATTARGLLPVRVEAIGGIAKRGIDQATCEKWGYGYSTYNGRVCQVATYRDAKGQPAAQKLRFAGKEFQILGDAKSMRLYGEWLWRDGGRMVVVTEGEIDALSMSQVQDNRWPVVSVPNGAQSAKRAIEKSLDWLARFDKVVFMFDQDEPGQAAALECATVLEPGKACIATLPLKDANEMLQAGRGKDLINAMWSARQWRPDGLVAGPDAWSRVVDQVSARAIALPHKVLNEKMRGLRMGEITTLVAGTKIGKSTFCREIAFHAMQQGEKVGYIALEESVRRSALGFLSIAVNRPMHFAPIEELRTAEMQEAYASSVAEHVVYYDHFGSLADANLMSRIRYMVKGEKCSVIVLDHLSIVVSGMDAQTDERRVLDQMMTKLASFVQEADVAFILVSHLSRQKGTPHEEGGRVSLSHLRGTHGIGQLSHNVVALERNQQAEGDDSKLTRVRLLACRHTGESGLCGFLGYDKETGRLQERTGLFEDVSADDDGYLD